MQCCRGHRGASPGQHKVRDCPQHRWPCDEHCYCHCHMNEQDSMTTCSYFQDWQILFSSGHLVNPFLTVKLWWVSTQSIDLYVLKRATSAAPSPPLPLSTPTQRLLTSLPPYLHEHCSQTSFICSGVIFIHFSPAQNSPLAYTVRCRTSAQELQWGLHKPWFHPVVPGSYYSQTETLVLSPLLMLSLFVNLKCHIPCFSFYLTATNLSQISSDFPWRLSFTCWSTMLFSSLSCYMCWS